MLFVFSLFLFSFQHSIRASTLESLHMLNNKPKEFIQFLHRKRNSLREKVLLFLDTFSVTNATLSQYWMLCVKFYEVLIYVQ